MIETSIMKELRLPLLIKEANWKSFLKYSFKNNCFPKMSLGTYHLKQMYNANNLLKMCSSGHLRTALRISVEFPTN